MNVIVCETENNKYSVVVDGVQYKTDLTHTEAWKIADRLCEEALSPVEDRHDYGFRQFANE